VSRFFPSRTLGVRETRRRRSLMDQPYGVGIRCWDSRQRKLCGPVNVGRGSVWSPGLNTCTCKFPHLSEGGWQDCECGLYFMRAEDMDGHSARGYINLSTGRPGHAITAHRNFDMPVVGSVVYWNPRRDPIYSGISSGYVGSARFAAVTALALPQWVEADEQRALDALATRYKIPLVPATELTAAAHEWVAQRKNPLEAQHA
jgi:hypothetical protein